MAERKQSPPPQPSPTKGGGGQNASRLKRAVHPMPEDVSHALKRHKVERAYAARPAYQQNDYVGWITGAKRDETRDKRLTQMLDELAAGDVYMGMRWRPRGS